MSARPTTPAPLHHTTCRLRCFFIEPRNGMFCGVVYQGNNDGARFDLFSRVRGAEVVVAVLVGCSRIAAQAAAGFRSC